MPVMTDRRSVAANATVDNVLAGKIDEFLREASIVTLYAAAEAVGVNVSLIIGNEVAFDDQEITSRAAGASLIVPDDFMVQAAGLAGDRMVLRLRNTTGAAIIVRTRLETTPAS
jgi:hypothetical protein